MRHRPPNILPEVSNAAPDLDQLDDVSFPCGLQQKLTETCNLAASVLGLH